MTRLVVLGDIHIPFHDQRALQLVLAFLPTITPDVVVLNGDIADQYEISSFDKDPRRKASLVSELAEVESFLTLLREIVPKSRIVYIYGNHEHRFHKYLIREAPALVGLKGMSLREQLNLEKLNIEAVETHGDRFTDNYVRFGNLLVGHFDKAHKNSGFSAKALLDEYGESLIQAHVHSVGSSNKTLESRQIMGWEGGCLCDLNPLYTKQKKWAHCFHVVDMEQEGHFFHVQQVLLVNYQFLWGAELWRG